MKKVLLFIAFIAFVTNYTFAQGLIISEVVDGPGSGGLPKYVELTNTTGTSIDLNGYKIYRYSNGGSSASTAYEFTEEFNLPSTESIVITSIDNVTDGEKWSDFNLTAPTHVVHDASGISGNGDDVYELVNPSDNAIDVYGVIGVDGTDENWEYMDSYSYRKSTIYSPASTFNVVEWFVAGANFLDDKQADLSPYLTPGTHTLSVSTGTIDLTNPVGGEDYDTGETVDINWTSSDVDSVLILVRMEESADYFPAMDNAVLASLGTFALQIPTNAEESNYKIKLVAKEDPTVADSCDFFISQIFILQAWMMIPFILKMELQECLLICLPADWRCTSTNQL